MNNEELLDYVIDEETTRLQQNAHSLTLTFSKSDVIGGIIYLTPAPESTQAQNLLDSINITKFGNTDHPYANRALWQIIEDLEKLGYNKVETNEFVKIESPFLYALN